MDSLLAHKARDLVSLKFKKANKMKIYWNELHDKLKMTEQLLSDTKP